MKAFILFLALVTGAPAPAPKKHTILYFGATWCAPCRRMKAETLPNVSLPGHVLKVFDIDADPFTADSYGIDEIPAYVVLDGEGRPYRKGSGYRNVAQFVRFLNEGK